LKKTKTCNRISEMMRKKETGQKGHHNDAGRQKRTRIEQNASGAHMARSCSRDQVFVQFCYSRDFSIGFSWVF